MVSPFLSICDDGFAGGSNSMCCEPSRLVCPILAVTFFGSFTLPATLSVRVATQFLTRWPVMLMSGVFSSILRIEPTKTSATMTLLLPSMAKVSGICTYTVYAPDPLPGPPGSETFEIPCQPHELSTIAATRKTKLCQVRRRTPLIVTRFTIDCRFCLLLARSALVVRITDSRFCLLLARSALVVRITDLPPQQAARVRAAPDLTAATVRAPGSVPPDLESLRAPVVAV